MKNAFGNVTVFRNKKKLAVVCAAFLGMWVFPAVVSASYYTQTDTCASGFENPSLNGTYTFSGAGPNMNNGYSSYRCFSQGCDLRYPIEGLQIYNLQYNAPFYDNEFFPWVISDTQAPSTGFFTEGACSAPLTLIASTAVITVGAVSAIGSGLLVIFTAVISLMLAVFLFRKGVRWAKHSGK